MISPSHWSPGKKLLHLPFFWEIVQQRALELWALVFSYFAIRLLLLNIHSISIHSGTLSLYFLSTKFINKLIVQFPL